MYSLCNSVKIFVSCQNVRWTEASAHEEIEAYSHNNVRKENEFSQENPDGEKSRLELGNRMYNSLKTLLYIYTPTFCLANSQSFNCSGILSKTLSSVRLSKPWVSNPTASMFSGWSW